MLGRGYWQNPIGLRATYHSSIAASPGQIVFGRDMVINSLYLANWKNLASRRETQIHSNNVAENKSRIFHDYHIDDLVYIRKSALEQKLAPSKALSKSPRSTLMGPLRSVVPQPSANASTFADCIPHLHAPIREASAIR